MNNNRGNFKNKPMSYRYWLAGMIAQGSASIESDPEEFADEVVKRANAIIDKLRQDKIDRNCDSEQECEECD